jgi:prophage regulatory protein
VPDLSIFCVIRLVALCAKLQVSKSTVYGWIDPKSNNYHPDFPLPVRLGKSTIGWIESEVDAYLLRLIEQRNSGRTA